MEITFETSVICRVHKIKSFNKVFETKTKIMNVLKNKSKKDKRVSVATTTTCHQFSLNFFFFFLICSKNVLAPQKIACALLSHCLPKCFVFYFFRVVLWKVFCFFKKRFYDFVLKSVLVMRLILKTCLNNWCLRPVMMNHKPSLMKRLISKRLTINCLKTMLNIKKMNKSLFFMFVFGIHRRILVFYFL
jgi:hypothetical protein